LNLSLAGEESVLPAASVARTLNLCLPFFSRLYFLGDLQGLNGFLSSLHSKLEPGSEEVNLNLTVCFLVFFGAPLVIVVSGAVRSPCLEASVGH